MRITFCIFQENCHGHAPAECEEDVCAFVLTTDGKKERFCGELSYRQLPSRMDLPVTIPFIGCPRIKSRAIFVVGDDSDLCFRRCNRIKGS